MAEKVKLEIEIDEECLVELDEEASRLGLTTAQLAQRAIAALMTDIRENSCCDAQA